MAKLCDLGKIVTGNTPKTSDTENYSSLDIPFVKPSDILEDELVSIRNSEFYISEKAREKARIIPPGSILVTCIGIVGKVAINQVECAFNQQINVIIPDAKKCDAKYVAYAIQHLKPKLQNIANAAVVPIINKAQFSQIEIVLPSLDEQHRIAAVLDKVTDLIAQRRTQLDKLDLLVKSRFVEMFGEPIANPMKWPVFPLKELSSLITNGNTPKGGSKNYVEHGIIFLRSQNVWRNQIILDDVAYITEETHIGMRKSSLHNRDILITKTGRINTENSSLGRAALFFGKDDSANINGHVYLVRLNNMAIPEYVVTILTGEAYRKYIRKVCVGGIDKRQINIEQVEDFPIILPPVNLQKEFANFRNKVFNTSEIVHSSLRKLEITKKILMQQYFN